LPTGERRTRIFTGQLSLFTIHNPGAMLMIRFLPSIFVVTCLALTALPRGNAEESPRAEPAKAEKAAPATKGDAKKELPVPSWVPKHLQGTPIGARLAQIQVDLDKAQAQLGPARTAADKARHAAHQAEHKANNLLQQVKWLESEKLRLLDHGAKQLRDTTLDKRDFENDQKIKRLEVLVRELTARLEAATKQTPAPARPAPVKKPGPTKK
jgi:hypothetical protein